MARASYIVTKAIEDNPIESIENSGHVLNARISQVHTEMKNTFYPHIMKKAITEIRRKFRQERNDMVEAN